MTKREMSEKQRHYQNERGDDGRYQKIDCQTCGRSAGVDYYSDHRCGLHDGYEQYALVLCERCAVKGEGRPHPQAIEWYKNRVEVKAAREASKSPKPKKVKYAKIPAINTMFEIRISGTRQAEDLDLVAPLLAELYTEHKPPIEKWKSGSSIKRRFEDLGIELLVRRNERNITVTFYYKQE